MRIDSKCQPHLHPMYLFLQTKKCYGSGCTYVCLDAKNDIEPVSGTVGQYDYLTYHKTQVLKSLVRMSRTVIIGKGV